MITASELRQNINTMTRIEIADMRDQLESNWSESLRPLMLILSFRSLEKFKTKLIEM